MLNKEIMVEALAVLRLQEYAKLLKNTSFAVFFLCNNDSITIYSTGDCLYSTINRIIIPNTIGITGIMAFPMTEFNNFCKNLILPSIPVLVSTNMMQIADNPNCKMPFLESLERDFLLRLDRLEKQIYLESGSFTLSSDSEVSKALKDKLLSMKSSMQSEIICIYDRYLITVFAGMLPLNKADKLEIRIIDDKYNVWYMIEYIIIKKKYEYPISVFHKYRRL